MQKRLSEAERKARDKASKAAYYLKNRDQIVAAHATYNATHKIQNKEYAHRYNAALRQSALQHYGAACACCGERQQEFLAVDHIAGGGNQHRRSIGGSLHLWLKTHNYPPGFQVLCHNCNMAKAFYGQCPHQRKEAQHE